MSSYLDFDKLAETYAVMGNPVSHSKSPRIHEEFGRQTGKRLEYTAIQVDPGGFAQAVGNFQSSGGRGLNITVPFKREAWELVDERSPRAEIAGSVNTIQFRADGRLYGDNTDGAGLVRDLKHNHGYRLAGKRILVVGGGGAVRGIIDTLLAEEPAELFIANRTVDKAMELADAFARRGPVNSGGYNELDGMRFNLVINGTSLSIQNRLPPLPDTILTADGWCYDMMYGDQPTVFVQWGLECGAQQSLDGLGMLVEQAAESFQLWHGVMPDTAPVLRMLRKPN
jgi:shikimate dehydrogenase